MSVIIEKAKTLATQKHAHLRMYNAARSPVILHIAEVASYTEQYGGTEDMIAAAWLHDIVEDTDTSLEDIDALFGPGIAAMVDGLTDPPHFAPLPLTSRKAMQAERVKEKSNSIKLIKICDQLSNVLRLVNDPPTDGDERIQFEYISGARKITQNCRGINAELDALFDEVYQGAFIKYGYLHDR